MATGQGQIRSDTDIVAALLVPRPVTRLALLVVGVVLAQVAWWILGKSLLGYVAGIAGPFCVLCATAVWGMRDKADDTLGGSVTSPEQFQRERRAARAVRARSTARAAWAALCGLLAASPAVSLQMTGDIWHWMVLAAGAGTAEAAYSYLIAMSWEDQLIALKDEKRLEELRTAERQRLVAQMEASKVIYSNVTKWDAGQGTLKAVSHH